MYDDQVVTLLSALGKRTRLEAFRLLVASEPKGLAAKELGKLLGIRKHAATNHLGSLAKTRLVVGTQVDGTTIYSANLSLYDEMVRHLTNDVREGETLGALGDGS